jgi:hypothetical protein
MSWGELKSVSQSKHVMNYEKQHKEMARRMIKTGPTKGQRTA